MRIGAFREREVREELERLWRATVTVSCRCKGQLSSSWSFETERREEGHCKCFSHRRVPRQTTKTKTGMMAKQRINGIKSDHSRGRHSKGP